MNKKFARKKNVDRKKMLTEKVYLTEIFFDRNFFLINKNVDKKIFSTMKPCDILLNCPFYAFLQNLLTYSVHESFDAFWVKNLLFSNFVSLWHISKLPILCIFSHFSENLSTYNVNETFFDLEKMKEFIAWMHFDWKINSFQISCHCDISLNCQFCVFFDTF